jgi:hypothetical protein
MDSPPVVTPAPGFFKKLLTAKDNDTWCPMRIMAMVLALMFLVMSGCEFWWLREKFSLTDFATAASAIMGVGGLGIWFRGRADS